MPFFCYLFYLPWLQGVMSCGIVKDFCPSAGLLIFFPHSCLRHFIREKNQKASLRTKILYYPLGHNSPQPREIRDAKKICLCKVPPSLYKLLANNTPFFISFCQTLISFWVIFFSSRTPTFTNLLPEEQLIILLLVEIIFPKLPIHSF